MEKIKAFADRLTFALSMNGLPASAPKVHAWINLRAKALKIDSPAKSRQTVYNWLSGKTPDPDGYAKLSLILNVSTYWLITGEVRPIPSIMASQALKNVPVKA